MTDADGTRTAEMAGESTRDAGPTAGDAGRPTDAVVTAHTSAPDRTVLTERGNTDGWIASSLTVDLSR